MNKNYFFTALAFLTCGSSWADDLPKDTLRRVTLKETVVIATPKENRQLRELPLSVNLLSPKELQTNRIKSIKNLTAIVPNVFIPNYGSKMTSAVYIRGIGSRINTPSVGVYVDNVPFIEKSAFDFNYASIERIDVLRGPQGTLYGRNAMGGLIKVYTKSPLNDQGTDLKLEAATDQDYNIALTHHHKVSDQLAFSASGFYEQNGGAFRNEGRDQERVARIHTGGGHLRGLYRPSSKLTLDLTVNYEYSDQNGYPYQYTGMVNQAPEPLPESVGRIAYNHESGYNRSLLHTGLNLEYQTPKFIINAVTGWQHLNDNMQMDQDFTTQDFFSLVQKQRSNILSEELIVKPKKNQHWQWTTGVFGLYQWLQTDGPVTFQPDGCLFLQGQINRMFPDLSNKGMHMGLTLPNQFVIDGQFQTPVLNAAIYHQSTFRDFLMEGLSVTLGIRLDYEKQRIRYHSATTLPFTFRFDAQMGPTSITIPQEVATTTAFDGQLSHDYVQCLPKLALQYDVNAFTNVYASISKGYRSGGYNIQMFSDLLQNNLSNGMKGDLKEALLANPHVPEMAKGMITTYLTPGTNLTDVESCILYRPEYSWNYEIGSHLTAFDGKLSADMALFYTTIFDQQISQFAEKGMGRLTVNAGKSRSYGAELSLCASLTKRLDVHAAYGYTRATFTDYIANPNSPKEVSYNGHDVPFVPKHTVTFGAQYAWQLANRYWLDRILLTADYTGMGRIYWTDSNDVSQPFYALLNGSVTLSKKRTGLTLWVRNITDKAYRTFYFESMNKGFCQQGKPLQVGVSLHCKL